MVTVRVRPSPREKILEFFRYMKETEGFSRSEIAVRFGITYWSARYWLEKLAEEKLVRKEIIRIGKQPYARRIFYYRIIPVVYYRTQYAILFYVEVPRTKTPDPIAEFRTTVVSNVRDKYDLKEFERACIYVGVILAPQTYWIKQGIEVTAYEKDEPIDVDELMWSVPAKKRLNYAERYAVFFRSRRSEEDYWRVEHPYYWADPTSPLPMPRDKDYEYGEDFIKDTEEKKVLLGTLKVKFDNERGEMVSVTV